MKNMQNPDMTQDQLTTIDKFWDNYSCNRKIVHDTFRNYMRWNCNESEEAERIISLETKLISPAEYFLSKDADALNNRKHTLNAPKETQIGVEIDGSQLDGIILDNKGFLRKRNGHGIDASPYYLINFTDLERSNRDHRIPDGLDIYLRLFCDFAVYQASRKLPMHVAHAVFMETANEYSRIDHKKSELLKKTAKTLERTNQLVRCALGREILSRTGLDRSIITPQNDELKKTITNWESTGLARKAYTHMAEWRKFLLNFNIPEEEKTLIKSTRLLRTYNSSLCEDQARRDSTAELLNRELDKILGGK